MKSLFFVLTFTLPTTLCLANEHKIWAEIGTVDFGWEEFRDEEGVRQRVVNESGNLPKFGLGYGYTDDNQTLLASYSNSSGNVDYTGRSNNPLVEELLISEVEYSINNIELEYGAWFEMDYIKPYAAILGGYHLRERNILPPSDMENGLDEKITFYYWGLKLEAEIFDWNNVTWSIGGEFNRSVKTKNNVITYNRSDGQIYKALIPLEAIVSTELYTKVGYSFLQSWEVSAEYRFNRAKTDQSDEVVTVVEPLIFTNDQPESEQELNSLTIRLAKHF